MGVLSRINDIIRSNLNELVSKAENPEKLLKQAILDMEKHLQKAREQLIQTIASEKTMEKKKALVMEQAGLWERRAALAVSRGDEELAKQALIRRNEALAHASMLEEQIRIQREYLGALRQSLVSLEERYREARAKKQALLARARVARARRQTARMLSPEKLPGIAGSRAFETFDRMEDKIMELESQVEAYANLASSDEPSWREPATEARFAALEKDLQLERQLEDLKKKIAAEKAVDS
jgi:phage shock protein A